MEISYGLGVARQNFKKDTDQAQTCNLNFI